MNTETFFLSMCVDIEFCLLSVRVDIELLSFICVCACGLRVLSVFVRVDL